MYCTTPSGTRYQTGSPAATRLRHSLEEMASAGISTRDTLPSGSPAPVSRCPGLVQPTKCASENSSSTSCQVSIFASASAPVMKYSSASGPFASSQVAQRVDRVGRPRPVDIHPADAEPGVGGGRDHRHQVPVLGRGDRAAVLLPGLRRLARKSPRPARRCAPPRCRRRGAHGGPGRTCRPSPRSACARFKGCSPTVS